MGRILRLDGDVDTDQTVVSQYPLYLSIEEMAPHCFESLDENFTSAVRKGDFAMAHDNFGCGSLREQAPVVSKASGARVAFASSSARIFFRDAISIGLPVVVCEGLIDKVKSGKELSLDMKSGTVCVNEQSYRCIKLPPKMQAILGQGGLIAALNREKV